MKKTLLLSCCLLMHGSTLYVEPDYFEEEPTARVDQPDTEPNKRGRSLLAEHLDSLDQAKKQSNSVQPEIDIVF